MAGMVDEHCTLVLAARLFGAVHNIDFGNICEQDMLRNNIEPADYHFERPIYDILVADVEAMVRNALKELGRRSFRDGGDN